MKKKEICMFDFDGVLIDSSGEIVIAAYNMAADKFCTDEVDLPADFAKVFRASKGSARDAGEMTLLGKAILRRLEEGNSDVVTRFELETEIEQSDISKSQHASLFFERRQSILDKNSDAWLALHKPFEPLWSFLQGVPKEERYLLTHKNLSSVLFILDGFDLEILDNHIYSSDTGKTKFNNFNDAHQVFGMDSYIVVDDAPNNLVELADNKPEGIVLKLFHANWGYGAPTSDFESRNIQSVEMETLMPILEEHF